MSFPQPVRHDTLAVISRILALAVAAMLPVILLAMWFVLSGPDAYVVRPAHLGGLLVAGVATSYLIDAVGYRVQPLRTGADAGEVQRSVRGQWTSQQVVRTALSEAVALVSLALAFVAGDGGFLIAVVGVLVSLVLFAVHAWPSRRAVDRIASGLEAAGTPSGLRESFGHAGDPGRQPF
ncbi:MAG: hypothetical protein ACI379_06910 [Nocardioides sp.]|uniref:hypothetical protein n=1 Tax=Nocardioides sp. TaxID=35761 RepID=UPI003F0F2428